MAEWLFMGTMNPDEIKHELYSRKVMDYREELKETYGTSTSSGRSHGTTRGNASGSGGGGTEAFDDDGERTGTSESGSDFSSESESESDSWSESETTSKTYTPMLVPVMGEELSHVQFRSLEEQLFRAMAVLFDQEQRQGVARLVGMNAPVSIYTPDVEKKPGSEERTKRFLEKCYRKLPFAVPAEKAKAEVANRAERFAERLLEETADEPRTAKRRIL